MLKIWGECEELFFKTANPEGEIIRTQAQSMATPIKENIQNFFEEDGSEYDFENIDIMKWNSENPGRIEIRIFNSFLEPEIKKLT